MKEGFSLFSTVTREGNLRPGTGGQGCNLANGTDQLNQARLEQTVNDLPDFHV
jgi:hypothetical protein